MLPLNEKVNVLDLVRKRKAHAEVAKIYARNKPICETVKKEKEIHARFAVLPQTVKVMATVHGKCLIKIKRH